MAVVQRLWTDGVAGDAPARAPVVFGRQGFSKVNQVFALVEHQLAVLRVHHVDRIAQHHNRLCGGDEIADLVGG